MATRTIKLTINLQDSEFVDVRKHREMYALSAYDLDLVVMDGTARADLTGGAVSLKIYDAAGEYVDLAGTLTNAAQGEATISIAADTINFSGDYTVAIYVDDSIPLDLPVQIKKIGAAAPSPATTIDWNTYAGYSNTAASGPYTAGDNIAFGTADAAGRVPINAEGLASNLLTVRNATGTDINHGAYVRVSGSIGQTPTIALVDNTTLAGIEGALGFVVAAGGVPNNTTVTDAVQFLNTVEGLDTSGATEGDTAYAGTNGGIVYAAPGGGAEILAIGVVTNAHPTLGKILLDRDFQGTALGYALKTAADAAAARTLLDAAGLADDQTFTGENTFSDNLFISAALASTGLTPARKVHIRDDVLAMRLDRGSANGPFHLLVKFTDNTYTTVAKSWIVGQAGTDGAFEVSDLGTAVTGSGTPRFRIDPTSGSILIGTTTDRARLTVKGAGGTSSTDALEVVNTSDTVLFRIDDAGTTFASIMQALGVAGLTLKDSTGTTHATVTADGVALDQLTASLPLSLDANKRAVTLSAANFRTLIGLVIGTDVQSHSDKLDEKAKIPVYIFWGQSNMDGRPQNGTTDLAGFTLPNSQCKFYSKVWDNGAGSFITTSGSDFNVSSSSVWGPEVAFVEEMSKKIDGEFVLIKVSKSGTSLASDWDPSTGTMYADLESVIDDVITDYGSGNLVWKGVYSMQGEADANTETHAQAWYSNYVAFLAAIETKVGKPVPATVGVVSWKADVQWRFDVQLQQCRPDWEWVPTSDLSRSDGNHYDDEGLITLGRRFAGINQPNEIWFGERYDTAEYTAITGDGTWRILTGSDAYTEGFSYLLIRVVAGSSASSYIQFRPTGGNSGAFYDVQRTVYDGVDYEMNSSVIKVPLIKGKTIEYRAGTATFTGVNITIIGGIK